MIVNEVWAQLETDLEWRQAELRALSNIQATARRQAERDYLRRAMLVMLYAHAEGFCKVAFLVYVNAINKAGTTCSDAPEVLVAAAFADIFHALAHGDPKQKVFSDAPHPDPKLAVLAREREFISKLPRFLGRPLQVPDTAVNTEDNLSSRVIRRNLYRLGFSEDLLKEYHSEFDELLKRRCSIAHGADPGPVKEGDYTRLQAAIFRAMDHLALSLAVAVEDSNFVRRNPN